MMRAGHTPEAQILRGAAPQGHLSPGPPLSRATFCPGSAGTSGRAEEAFVSRLTIRQLAIRRLAIRRLTIRPISPAPPSPLRLGITSLRDHKPLVIAPLLRSAPSTTSAIQDLRGTIGLGIPQPRVEPHSFDGSGALPGAGRNFKMGHDAGIRRASLARTVSRAVSGAVSEVVSEGSLGRDAAERFPQALLLPGPPLLSELLLPQAGNATQKKQTCRNAHQKGKICQRSACYRKPSHRKICRRRSCRGHVGNAGASAGGTCPSGDTCFREVQAGKDKRGHETEPDDLSHREEGQSQYFCGLQRAHDGKAI